MDVQISAAFLDAHPGIKEAVETGMIEGVPFKITGYGEDLAPGDTYIAERNSGLKLLTCRENNAAKLWIIPVEMAYVYDTGECLRIELNLD